MLDSRDRACRGFEGDAADGGGFVGRGEVEVADGDEAVVVAGFGDGGSEDVGVFEHREGALAEGGGDVGEGVGEEGAGVVWWEVGGGLEGFPGGGVAGAGGGEGGVEGVDV